MGKRPPPATAEDETSTKEKKWKYGKVEIVIEADIQILVNECGKEDSRTGRKPPLHKNRHTTTHSTNSKPISPLKKNNYPALRTMETNRPRSHSANAFLANKQQKDPLLSKLLPGMHPRTHSNPHPPSPSLTVIAGTHRQSKDYHTIAKRCTVAIPNPHTKDPVPEPTTPNFPTSPNLHKSPRAPSSLRNSGTIHTIKQSSPTIITSPPTSPYPPSSPAVSPPISPSASPRTLLDSVKGGPSIKRAMSCPVINSCVLLDQLLNTSTNKSPLLAPTYYPSPPHSPHHHSSPSPRFPSTNGMNSALSGAVTHKVTWWGGSNIGARAENQDCFLIPPNDANSDILLFGVFDGHGPEGKHAADTAKSSIGNYFEEQQIAPETNIDHSLMRGSFLTAHNAIMDKATNDFGTTAVVAALRMSSSQLYFGWVGDSKAIICRKRVPHGTPQTTPHATPQSTPLSTPREADISQGGNGGYFAVELTKDHVLSSPEEMDRIYGSGGVIRNVSGMTRVFIPELYSAFYGAKVGGLNMSRSLGHLYLSRFGVVPDPDFGEEGLQPNDFVIIATDGLWGRMTPTEVCKFIADRPKMQNSPEDICEALIEEAKLRWGPIADNITVIVLLSSQNTS